MPRQDQGRHVCDQIGSTPPVSGGASPLLVGNVARYTVTNMATGAQLATPAGGRHGQARRPPPAGAAGGARLDHYAWTPSNDGTRALANRNITARVQLRIP